MGMSTGPVQNNYPWATRFIEIALRAIRRVHYEYGVWGVGHQWMRDVSDPPDLNTGPGIELADEPTVCAAITQEFANSQFVAGIWQERKPASGVSEGERFWRIDRERCYEGSQERVDICIHRYERKRLDEVPRPTSGPPVFIEAKRARRWSAQISTGSLKRSQELTSEIKNDIKKLRREMESQQVYCHLLVWNIYESPTDGPLEFFERLQAPCVTVHQVRWLPLTWTCPSYVESEVDWKPYSPEVNKWLWIALAEVSSDKGVSQEL